MKNGCIVLLLLIAAQTGTAQKHQTILPVVYNWKTPATSAGQNILVTTLFEGSAHDMEYLRMEAALLAPSTRKTTLLIEDRAECLFLVKAGMMTISFGDSTRSIGPGSIALLMPGEKYSLQNATDRELLFYRMTYRSKTPVENARGKSGGGSFVMDWNKLPFIAHSRGGVRRYFERPTAMCRRFEMHVTTLNAGLTSHDPHTHRAEEIVLVLEDNASSKSETEMQIGDKFFKGEAGDVYFLASGVLHGIKNIGSTACSYFAFQFE